MRTWPPPIRLRRKPSAAKVTWGLRVHTSTLALLERVRALSKINGRPCSQDDVLRVALYRLSHSLETAAERAGIDWRSQLRAERPSDNARLNALPKHKYRPPIE